MLIFKKNEKKMSSNLSVVRFSKGRSILMYAFFIWLKNF